MKEVNRRLQRIEDIVNDDSPQKVSSKIHVGVDLGTADIMVLATDEHGEPLAAFMEWAEVVRDGIVLDYWGATQIVKRLVRRIEQKLSIRIQQAITSFPPGTDPRTSENVIRAAGLKVETVIDEPSSVIRLLHLKNGAVIDIGGGTTGLAVVKGGQIVYTADEATGGRHVTLTIAGNRKISYEEAETLKLNGQAESLLPVVEPVFQKMADILRHHLGKYPVQKIYCSGGTCCFPHMDRVLQEELPEKEIIMPYNPLYLTPLAIASYRVEKEGYEPTADA